jgi:hypothetical protein
LAPIFGANRSPPFSAEFCLKGGKRLEKKALDTHGLDSWCLANTQSAKKRSRCTRDVRSSKSEDKKDQLGSRPIVIDAMPFSLEKLFDHLRTSDSDVRDELLAELGLSSLPSRSELEDALVERFLTPKHAIPSHWLSSWQEHWDDSAREKDVKRLLYIDRAETRTSLEWDWEGLEGKVKGYKEVCAICFYLLRWIVHHARVDAVVHRWLST